MKYFGVPLQSALWLSGKDVLLERLADAIAMEELGDLRKGDFVAGAVRIALESSVVVLLNAEYATASGDEPFGFVRIARPYKIGHHLTDVAPAFKRALYVVTQRLQSRTFWTRYGYEADGERHSITAYDGSPLKLGWIESPVLIDGTVTRTVLLFGPGEVASDVTEAARSHVGELHDLVQSVRNVLKERRSRKVFNGLLLPAVRHEILPDEPKDRVTTFQRRADVTPDEIYVAQDWTFDYWCNGDPSTLSRDQRRILVENAPLTHPLRLVGPAGAGKTLLMQLMAIKSLRERPGTNALYVTHNDAMERRVRKRFDTLGAGDLLRPGDQQPRLHVSTLSRYARDIIELKAWKVISLQPDRAKDDAFDFVKEALSRALDQHAELVARSATLRTLTAEKMARRYLEEYVRAEISSVIKGHGTTPLGRNAYTDAQDALGPLHAVLTPEERDFIYDVYTYYKKILDEYEVLDSDDVAITFIGRLLTPYWDQDRKKFGFDFVFVDEAQLFNDNERQIVALLTKSHNDEMPIAIALDEGQRLYTYPASGLGLLGMPDVERKSLQVSHRLSPAIANLSFHVISKSTAILEDDFPKLAEMNKADEEGKSAVPVLYVEPPEKIAIRAFDLIMSGRDEGFRQFAIVAHSEVAMARLREVLPRLFQKAKVSFDALYKRGEPQPNAVSYVILARPEVIGGQEFDCVISCGLEEGVVPPTALSGRLQVTLEQQALREIYLTFTRARHRLYVLNLAGSTPSPALRSAITRNLLRVP